MNMMVTGGNGFIGTNFIKYWLKKYPDDVVVNVDAVTYAGIGNNHSDTERDYPGRYFFVKADICDYQAMLEVVYKFSIDTIVNFAAESHNSYSIINPTKFFMSNLIGTQTLLELTRQEKVKRMHHISTCEVYGDLPLDSDEAFFEDSPLLPNSPYNASKACADLAVRAYFRTYKIPVTISNCSNNYGPYQFIEKLIPLFITNLMQDKKLTLYRSSSNRREWLHVLDHCSAIDTILSKGVLGEKYNIGSGCEKSIEDIAAILLKKFNKSDDYKEYVPDRPSHDMRYLLDSSKLRKELGWKPQIEFESGIESTIDWYIEHEDWWRKLIGHTVVSETAWNK